MAASAAAAAELVSRRERRASAAAEGVMAVVEAETPRSGFAAKAWARRWMAMAMARGGCVW
jgi:predicted nucleotidyltransferase